MTPTRLLGQIDSRALARFAAGGILSSGVTLGVATLLHEVAGVRETWSAAGGLACALASNFLLSRFFIFRGTTIPVRQQLLRYIGMNGAFRVLEYLGFLVLHLVGVHYLLALVLVLGASFVVKFLAYDKFVFARGSLDHANADRDL